MATMALLDYDTGEVDAAAADADDSAAATVATVSARHHKQRRRHDAIRLLDLEGGAPGPPRS